MAVATITRPAAVAEGYSVIYGQPDRDYRRAEGVSQSELKEILRSPAHYLARYGPDAVPTFPSAAMIIGTALHARVLEPETFDGLFCNRGEVAKEPTVAELKELLAAEGVEVPKAAKKPDLLALAYPDGLPTETRTTLAPEDFAAVEGMARALQEHPAICRHGWLDSEAPGFRRMNEVSIYAEASAALIGMPMKGRIDRLIRHGDGWIVIDLKSTDSAGPDDFQRKAFGLGYDLQAAYYSHLIEQALGGPVSFLFAAIERRAPHAIAIYQASAALLQSGREKMTRAADLLRFSRENDYWPSYGDGEILSLDPPAWARSKGPELPGF